MSHEPSKSIILSAPVPPALASAVRQAAREDDQRVAEWIRNLLVQAVASRPRSELTLDDLLG